MKRIGCLIGALFLLTVAIAKNSKAIDLLKQANAIKRTHADSAILLTQQALVFASTDSLKARTYYTLGNTYLIHDEYEKALIEYNKLLPLAIKNDTALLAKVYNNIGFTYQSISQYDTAIAYYYKSLQLKKGKIRASTLHNIGVVYRIMENYEDATKYYQKSFNIYSSYNDTSGIVKITNALGIVYLETEEYDKALSHFFEYLSLIPSSNLKKVRIANSNIGLVYQRMNQLESAYIYTSKALAISRQINDKVGVMVNLNNSANILRKQEKYTQALPLYKRASLIADSLNSQKELMEIYFAISETYGSIDNDKQELVYFKLFTAIKDTIKSQNTVERIEEEKLKYEQLEMEKDREIMAAKLKLISQRAKMAEYGMYALGTLLAITILFMILYRRIQRKKEENEYQRQTVLLMLESEEKTKEEISDKLYNELGTINTLTKYALLPFKELSEEKYNEVVDLINQASKTSRDISYQLFSMDLKTFGLGDAIKSLFAHFNRYHEGIQFDVQTNLNRIDRLPYQQEIHLFRVIQALLTNTIAHAKASHVSLFLMEMKKGKVTLRYKDNGIGFDVKNMPKGIGLKSVESRAVALDLKIKMKSSKGEGMEVILKPHIPIIRWLF